MADYILVVQHDVPEQHREEYNRLYNEEHAPHLLSVDGDLSVQRFEIERDSEDQLRYLVIYDLKRPDMPSSEEWKQASVSPAWTKARENITARRRGVFRRK